MFKVIAEPTFDAALTIVGQGRSQKLNLVYRHKTQSDYSKFVQQTVNGGGDDIDLAIGLVDAWDADITLDRPGLKLLEENQPGAVYAIVEGYTQGMMVAREKN